MRSLCASMWQTYFAGSEQISHTSIAFLAPMHAVPFTEQSTIRLQYQFGDAGKIHSIAYNKKWNLNLWTVESSLSNTAKDLIKWKNAFIELKTDIHPNTADRQMWISLLTYWFFRVSEMQANIMSKVKAQITQINSCFKSMFTKSCNCVHPFVHLPRWPLTAENSVMNWRRLSRVIHQQWASINAHQAQRQQGAGSVGT